MQKTAQFELQEIVVFIWSHTYQCGLVIKQVNTLQKGQFLLTKQYTLQGTYQKIRRYLANIQTYDQTKWIFCLSRFFVYLEFPMLIMTQDIFKNKRKLRYWEILKIRQLDQKETTIRTFMPPKRNFKDQGYSNMRISADYDLCFPLYQTETYLKSIFKVPQSLIGV